MIRKFLGVARRRLRSCELTPTPIDRAACQIDRGIEEPGGFVQATDRAPRHAESCEHAGEELSLPRRAAHCDSSLGVRAGLEKAVEVDLRPGEIDGGVQPPGELVV